MKKENLLKLIDRAIEGEDKAVADLSRNVISSLEWCGCSKGGRNDIESTLLTLGSECRIHKGILEELRDKIIASKKSDF